MSVSLKFTKGLNYNVTNKNTKSDVLQEQIRRTKFTCNQNQKLLKILILKVDNFHIIMTIQFETIYSQPSNVTCQDLKNKDEFYNHEFANKQTYQTAQHYNELGGGTKAIAYESGDNVNEILSKNLLSEHKTQTVARLN